MEIHRITFLSCLTAHYYLLDHDKKINSTVPIKSACQAPIMNLPHVTIKTDESFHAPGPEQRSHLKPPSWAEAGRSWTDAGQIVLQKAQESIDSKDLKAECHSSLCLFLARCKSIQTEMCKY